MITYKLLTLVLLVTTNLLDLQEFPKLKAYLVRLTNSEQEPNYLAILMIFVLSITWLYNIYNICR